MAYKKILLAGSGIAAAVGVSIIIKDNLGGPYFEEDVDLKKKIAIVTGANTGIGYHVALNFAERGARVYLACRDKDRCEIARQDIAMETMNKEVYCRYCDLSSLDSVRRFVKRIVKDEKKVDILVNNAGIMSGKTLELTSDGFESQIGVNHLGHFLLTNLLLEYLKKGAPSRVVNVSSIAHHRGEIDVEDLNSSNTYNSSEAYNQSKLANVLFTRELAKRVKGTGITVNAVHPGVVDTSIIRNQGFFKRSMMFVLRPFYWPFIKSARQGAQPVLHVALHPDLADVSGKYFNGMKEEDPSANALDDNLALWLWLVSEKWTRLADAMKDVYGITIPESKSIDLPSVSRNSPVKVQESIPLSGVKIPQPA